MGIKGILRYCLTCLLFAYYICCFSQNGIHKLPEYTFSKIAIGDIHNQVFIEDIIRDKIGYMWFASREGLFRYDGKSLKAFYNVIEDSTSLQNNSILSLCIDRNGILWVVTSNALHKYNQIKEEFTPYMLPKPADQTDGNNIMCKLFADNQHNIWVATWDRGLLKFNIQTCRFQVYGKSSFGTNTVRSIAQDLNGTLWIGSHNGLYTFKTSSNTIQEVLQYRKQVANPKQIQINTLYVCSGNKIWIGTNNGFVAFNASTLNAQTFSAINGAVPHDKNIVEDFYADNAGNLWVGTTNGLKIFNLAQSKFTHFMYGDNNNSEALLSSDIRVLYHDNSGTLWIGSHKGGINKYSTEKKNFESVLINSRKFTDNRIFSTFESPNGTIFIGTENGLYSIDPNTSLLTNYNYLPAISGQLIKAIVMDKRGSLWLGLDKGGLVQLDLAKKTAKIVFEGSEKPSSYASNDIWGIYEDKYGVIWIGTSGNGLVSYNPITKKTKSYINNLNINSISSNSVGCITEDNYNNLWVGTSAQGLNRFNQQSESFERFNHKPSSRNSIVNNTITCLYFLNDTLWIGTKEGLDALNVLTKKISHFDYKQGLDALNISSVTADKRNNLWVATFNGLFMLNANRKNFIRFDINDGLSSDQFITCSIFNSHSGNIYLGTENGLIYFNPLNIKFNNASPIVVISGFKLFNNTVLKGAFLNNTAFNWNKLNLSYKENYISFEFAALDYHNSDKNKFSWYLEGYDPVWLPATTQNTATYNNLMPGNYILHVKAINSKGLWSKNELRLQVSIFPPFYKTIWFKVLIALLFLSGILLYNYLKIRKIQTRNLILEQLVIKRTQTISLQKNNLEKANQNLQLQKDEIENQAKKLEGFNKNLQEQQLKIQEQAERLKEIDKLKTAFFTNISHEFRTPLTLIIGPLEKLIIESTDNIQSKQFGVMMRNAQRLLKLINQLLDLSMIDAGFLKLQVSKGNIAKHFLEIAESFQPRAERHKINYSISVCDAEFEGYADWDKTEKIAYNLLSNAFKNTPDGGSITFQTKLYRSNNELNTNAGLSNYIEIIVEDNGVGIPQNLLERIFDRFYRIEDSGSGNVQGSGIGLSLTKELVNAHYGNIWVESTIGSGSVFTVKLPVDTRSFNETEKLAIAHNSVRKINNFEFKQTNIKQAIPERNQDAENPHLLIIEDDRDLNEFLHDHFVKLFRVSIAHNGTEGLNTAIDQIPDIIISDIMLPGTDGISICNYLKTDERTSHIPIILLTAKNAETEKITGYRTGADDYITKPFELAVLDAKVSNMILQRKKLLERFGKIITLQPTNIEITSTDENFLQKAIDIIEKNIDQPKFDVEDFTREIGMGRTLLYRKIRALTNQSVNDFIRSIKLKRAGQLLQTGNFNVAEVVIRTGFINQSYFSKCFEQQFGELPSKYTARYKTI